MRVAIDFRITYNNDKAFSKFTCEFWEDIAALKPNHAFIFITEKEIAQDQPAKNIHQKKIKQSGFGWLDKKKLNSALSEMKADCLITIHDTGFLVEHLFNKREIKNKLPASQINFFTSTEQITKNKSLQPVASIIKPSVRAFITTLSWAEAESIRTQYTGGRSFFLFTGNISNQHQLVALLKAFSSFKKWQQSNMQLAIAGYSTAWTAILEEKLQTYKYKTDVVIIKNAATKEIEKLVAACYAVVFPVAENVFPMAMLLAVQSGKAVIATDHFFNRQITDYAEWVDKDNTAEGFAKAMILLYKDEKHLQLLIQQNNNTSKQFSRNHMLQEVWETIEK